MPRFMTDLQLFKAQKSTRRFNKNQNVFVSLLCANHIYIYFKYRGSGRYVRGIIDRFSPIVGDIKTIEIDDGFSKRIAL